MRMTYTDTDKASVIVYEDDGSYSFFSYPPVDEADKQRLTAYGGEYELERTWVEMAREAEAEQELWDKFIAFKDEYVADMTIQRLMDTSMSKHDMMQLKMSIFREECIKQCIDKDMLSKLRKAEDPITLVKLYGLIRDGI